MRVSSRVYLLDTPGACEDCTGDAAKRSISGKPQSSLGRLPNQNRCNLKHRPARLVQVLDLPLPLFRIRHHGPELIQAKPSLVEADPLLNEEARAGRGE